VWPVVFASSALSRVCLLVQEEMCQKKMTKCPSPHDDVVDDDVVDDEVIVMDRADCHAGNSDCDQEPLSKIVTNFVNVYLILRVTLPNNYITLMTDKGGGRV